MIVIATAFFLSSTSRTGNSKVKSALSWRPFVSSALFIAAGLFCFMTQKTIFLKLYSVAISLIFLAAFGSTLFSAPSMVFRLATLMDKTIKGSSWEKQVEGYCYKVTVVWCCFFILNGSVSVWTAFFASDRAWSIYNGGISYVLMGLLFAVEFIVRRRVDEKMIKVYPISKFKADSRKDSHILCYEEKFSSGKYKTWKDFMCDTAKLRKFISSKTAEEWILHCEDYWYFLVAFIALLQSGKKVFLTQNIAEYFLEEIKKEGM